MMKIQYDLFGSFSQSSNYDSFALHSYEEKTGISKAHFQWAFYQLTFVENNWENRSHSFFVVPFGEPSFFNFFYFAKVTIICWKNKSTSCKNPFFLSFLKIFWTQTSENSP
jgi:hypothetical protein